MSSLPLNLGNNGYTCLSKHGSAPESKYKFLVLDPTSTRAVWAESHDRYARVDSNFESNVCVYIYFF